MFSVLVAVLGLSISLLLAVLRRPRACAAPAIYKTLLIWPYAVAPAVAGVLWLFLFNPIARHPRALRCEGSASTGTTCSTAATR